MDATLSYVETSIVDGQDVISLEVIRLDMSMSWMLTYERAYRECALSAIDVVLTGTPDVAEDRLKEIVWAMAKNADPELTAPDQWLDDHPDIEWDEIKPVILVGIMITNKQTEPRIELTAKHEGGMRELKTTMQLIAAGISRGLTLNDCKWLTRGMWMDYITAHTRNNLPDGMTRPNVRKATQADSNIFKGVT